MSGYIEVMVAGDCRAFIEAGSICGVISPSGMGADMMATPDQTISIILRGGDTIPGVYGVSVMKIIAHVEGMKLVMKDSKKFCCVAFLDKITEFEAEIERALIAREMAGG